MRLAPGIRHNEAALRTRLKTFLEAVAVVRRNDQCPGFIGSRGECEGDDGQYSAEKEKHPAKNAAAVVSEEVQIRWREWLSWTWETQQLAGTRQYLT